MSFGGGSHLQLLPMVRALIGSALAGKERGSGFSAASREGSMTSIQHEPLFNDTRSDSYSVYTRSHEIFPPFFCCT